MPVWLPDFSERAEGSDSWRACKENQNGAEKDMSKVLFVSFHNARQTEYEMKLEGNVLKLPITSSLLSSKPNTSRAMNCSLET